MTNSWKQGIFNPHCLNNNEPQFGVDLSNEANFINKIFFSKEGQKEYIKRLNLMIKNGLEMTEENIRKVKWDFQREIIQFYREKVKK